MGVSVYMFMYQKQSNKIIIMIIECLNMKKSMPESNSWMNEYACEYIECL